jgi:polyhydroxybutyrate depolymerase
MKRIFTFFFFISFVFLLSSQKRYDVKFRLDGYDRECIIVAPGSAPPAGGYPVVFVLHGTSQDGEKFYNDSGWKELGEQEKMITVFPTALSWCYNDDGVEANNTKWVNGDLLAKPCVVPQNYIDDIRFFKKILSIIKDSVAVNASKVFATGFSNGSVMAHKLAMEAGDVFAAVGCGSGPLFELDSVNPPLHRIPIWFMVGSKDDRFIVPPYTELPFTRDSILAYMGVFLNRALHCQGLTSEFVYSETPTTHTYLFNKSVNGGISSSPYVFTLVKNMFHVYPNGTNNPLVAAKLYWEFFKQYAVVGTRDEAQNAKSIIAFPNPSTDQIHIYNQSAHSGLPFNLKVLNSYGQLVWSLNHITSSEFVLRKSQLGTGLFLLQVQQGNSIYYEKIVFE